MDGQPAASEQDAGPVALAEARARQLAETRARCMAAQAEAADVLERAAAALAAAEVRLRHAQAVQAHANETKLRTRLIRKKMQELADGVTAGTAAPPPDHR